MRTGRQTEQPRKSKGRTLRILLVLILFLIVAIAGAVLYYYNSTLDSLYVSFTEEAPSVEFGGDYPAMDYVSGSEGIVSPAEDSLEADTLGSEALVYTVSQPLFGGLLTPTRDFTLTYTVVDTVDPLILWNGSGTTLQRGTEFNLNDVLGYGDNADPAPAVTVDGKVDMDTSGSYPLHVTVTDASGNSAECDLTVIVADSVPDYPYTSDSTPFRKFVSGHKGKGRSFGIDVSTWQGDIDFKAVKAAGCDFVIIRIGYSVDGELNIDDTYEQNIERAREAGLRVGIYLFSYDNTIDKVRSSARWVVEKLGGSSLDLPVAFDWEDFGRFQEYEMSFTDLNNLYDAFAEELSAGGYDCMLYGSLNFLEKVWEDTNTRPIWLAHYTDKTDYEGPYMIWQASNTGRINGIDGDVDMNILYE